MNEAAITVTGLRKAYGEKTAVDGVDLRIARGEVFALLGPNGAGKTTTVEILEGHRQRDAGEVSVLGYDPGLLDHDFRDRIGIVLQETGVENYLMVEEVIELYRGYYTHPRSTNEVLKLVGLEEQRSMRVIKLSGGQKRRLDVGIAIAGDPDLLFLDEPTTGFDPAARRNAWDMVRGLRNLGKTIFLTTHYMEEAEALADRVAIIRRGEIVAEGPPAELAGATGATIVRFRWTGSLNGLIAGVEGAHVENEHVEIETREPTALLYELTRRARESSRELEELTVTRSSLEDTYLRLVQESAE